MGTPIIFVMKKSKTACYTLLFCLCGLLIYLPICKAGLFDEACDHAANSESDPERLLNYCFKAAEAGNARSQFILGAMYYHGIGVDKNKDIAVKWWFIAAKNGDSDAQHEVGRMFQRGDEVSKDYKKALNWYMKSAKQGNPYSYHNIAYMFQHGLGVKENIKSAKLWYERAAKLGLPHSQYNLSGVLFNNNSTTQELIKSYAWMVLAAQSNYLPAVDDLFIVELALSNQQKKQGGLLAHEIFVNNYTADNKVVNGYHAHQTLNELRAIDRRSDYVLRLEQTAEEDTETPNFLEIK